MLEASTYEAIRPFLKTGDMVLFGGRGAISRGIKRFTRSKWSHIGMVLFVEEWDMVCLWESTTLSTIPDLLTGTRRAGVQLVPLSQRMEEYDGEIAFRLVGRPPRDQELDGFLAFRKMVSRRGYEKSYIELLGVAFGWNKRENLSTVFCSELVAESYQSLGWLSDARPSNAYSPEALGRLADLQNDQTIGEILPIQWRAA